MNCLNCLNCKTLQSRTYLKCKSGHWQYPDGTKRVIKLTCREIVTPNMEERKIFKQRRCPDWIDMEE